MGTERADAVIVGAGLAGSAAARALASRGRSVVLVEAFQPGHRRGSSHGSARIFRRAYPDPLYVRLTGQAQVLWRQLADEAGEELVTTTGAVDYGSALPGKMYQILAGFGVPAELMKAEAAAERWPGMSFGRDPVLYHPDGGVIDPERAMAAMRGIAVAPGAQICYGSPVLRVEADGAGATVHTAAGRGARRWSSSPPGRGWNRCSASRCGCRRTGRDAAAGLPLCAGDPGLERGAAVAVLHPLRRDRYVRAAGRSGRRGAGGGQDRRARPGQGHHGRRPGRDRQPGGQGPGLRVRPQRLGGLDPAPVGEVTCLYTSTASEDFILDRYGPFVVCSPCSGHGAKFAPLVGEIAADLACGGASPDPRFTLAAHG